MKEMNTVLIGTFSEIYKGEYPSIKECIHDEAPENKGYVLDYLKRGRCLAASPGHATDVLTGEIIPIPLQMLTDEEYEWRSDLIYYYERYNVDLPEEFVQKAVAVKGVVRKALKDLQKANTNKE